MVKYTKFYYNTRYIMPLLIGMIVGLAFSLLCTPFYDCDNRISFSFFGAYDNQSRINIMRLKSYMQFRSQQEQHQFDILEQQQQMQIDEFEPRINLQGKPKKPQKPVQKLIRPRYISTELNIRNKLFIGIISTSRRLSNLASFLNQSTTSHANKVTFFINNAEMNEKLLLDTTPPGISVVNFNDDRDNLLPFHSFKYVIDNYIDSYNWFFFVTDNTYIRASELNELLNHISISQDLYMGNSISDKQSVYCSLSSGILFSNTLLRKILLKMEWCIKNSYSDDPTENIGRCVLHSSNMPCTQTANGRHVVFHLDTNFNFDNDIQTLINSDYFNKSLTVSTVFDIDTMKKLHLYYNKVEMENIKVEIDKIENLIYETVCETPEGCDSLIWPLGVSSPYKGANRHEIIRWDYFNLTHVYLGSDFDVVTEMTQYYKQDVDEIVDFCVKNLNDENPNRYVFKSIINGYKQFDPTRGASYILDLLLFDNRESHLIHKRVNVMRPLGLIEIIPVPYVTESAKITLVIAFTTEYDNEEILDFFRIYEEFILEIKEVAEKLNLFVIYLYSSTNTTNSSKYEKEKVHFSKVKNIIKDLSKKYSLLTSTSSRILEADLELANSSMYYSEGYRQLMVTEYVTQKVSNDALIAIGSPCIEIQSEFLNRIRLNTIRNNQVFFPIPFSEYMPNIVYPYKPFPDEVEINKNVGYFNTYSYEFVSFYNSDYLSTREKYILDNNLRANSNNSNPNSQFQTQDPINIANYMFDLYDFFSYNADLHLLRSTDQAFKCRWHLTENCDKKRSKNEMEQCYNQKEYGLGTKSQLAMHLMKNYETIFKTKK